MQGAGAAIYHGKDLTNNVEFLMGCTGVQSAVVGAMTNHPLHFRTNNTLIGQFTISGNLLINSDVDNGVDKLQVTGSLKSTSSVQVGNSAVIASSANVGAIRYRSDANNSYMDMVMQTGA